MTRRWSLLCLVFLGLEASSGRAQEQGAGRCYKNLGCFDIPQEFYDTVNRPVNLEPSPPEVVDTRFELFTRRNPMEEQELIALEPSTITQSDYDGSKLTLFIIHGFMDNKLYGNWEEELKTQLLLKGDFNVIKVDWSRGNLPPYTQATANTRIVGAEVAFLISQLMAHAKLEPSNVHIMGHSLGAHAAGYAGERIKGIGRITGLDPAWPYFRSMPAIVRLDPSDAAFVDVIHTDADPWYKVGLGLEQAVGHVDFYPNGGQQQPGCRLSSVTSLFTKGIIAGVRDLVACNHQRAIDLFIASINYRLCAPMGFLCGSWEEYQQNRCQRCGPADDECAVVGWRAAEFRPYIRPNVTKKMYLQTGASSPFCLQNYRVAIKMDPDMFKESVEGKLILYFNSRRVIRTFKVPDYINFHPGLLYTFRIKSTLPDKDINSITMEWIAKPWAVFGTPKVVVKYVMLEQLVPPAPGVKSLKKRTYFCDQSPTTVLSQKKVTFSLKSKCS